MVGSGQPGPSLVNPDRDAELLAYDSHGRYGFQRRVLELGQACALTVSALLQVVDPQTHLCLRETVFGRDWADLGRRNGAYLRLEDRLWRYRRQWRITRARHRRTGRIRIKLVDGPATGRRFTATATGSDAHPPMLWYVKDLSLALTTRSPVLIYQAGQLLDEDMIWPYRYQSTELV